MSRTATDDAEQRRSDEGRPRAAGRRGRYRRPQADRPRRRGSSDVRRDRVVAVPALVRLAAAVHARLRHFQRHRGARVPSVASRCSWRSRPIPAFTSSPRDRVPLLDWAAGRGRHRRRALSRRVLPRARAAARPADDAPISSCRWSASCCCSRPRAAPKGPWMPVISHHHAALRLPRALSAGPAGAQGRVARRAPPRISG